MIRSFLVSYLSLFSVFTADPCPTRPSADGDGLSAEAVVRYLAADSLEGRLAGSTGARCAAVFLAQRFRHLGLEPAGDDGTFFQEVPLASAVNSHAPGGTGRNVVGLLPGSDPALAGQAVVVGAHYDHLGRGGFSSLAASSEKGAVHNGADDNASGVAALLTVARDLARGQRPARTVVFVAFTGEELGLLGSTHYAEDPPVPLDSTVAMLNMDMVGRLGADTLIVYGTGTAEEWPDLLAETAETAGIPVSQDESGYGPSDHTAFYSRDVPVLHFFTNVHGDYHRPSDDWQKLDYAGIGRIASLVTDVTAAVAGPTERLTHRGGAGTPPSESEGQGYGAYLGTVPDFTPVDRGVRLSGVTDGSPADEAGLEAGDVIVGLGDHRVDDLYALTDALRAHRPGDTVRVRILRAEEERAFTAVLGSRSDRPRE